MARKKALESSSSGSYPDEGEVPAGEEPAAGPEGLPAGEPDLGMGAVEPVLGDGQQPALLAEEAGEGEAYAPEGGMGAVEPILRDEELQPEPGLPVAEMAKPDPETSMRGAPIFSADAFLAPGPLDQLAPSEAPLLTEERIAREELVALLINDEQLKALWARADVAKLSIDQHINTLQSGRTLLDQIKFFRAEILSGRDRYEDAERHLNEAEYRVAVNLRLRQWSTGLGTGLFLYELVWGGLALAVLFLWLGTQAFAQGASDLVYLAGSMAWGCLGGVIGAWYALVKHIARDQDFDPQHRMWYFNSPLMGIGVGAVVFAILRAGLLSVTGPGQSIASPFIIYIIAWLAGYQHNVFTDLVQRILKVFKIEEETKVEGAVSLDVHQEEGEEARLAGQVTASRRDGGGDSSS
jgi:hypothetical protein